MRRLALLFALLLLAPAWAGPTFRLTILHTNDLHGMMLPFDYTVREGHVLPQVGGLARRATALAQVRRELAGRPCVFVDAGDVFARGPWAEKCLGVPEIEALNAMGCDMMAVGNNEFKASPGVEAQDAMLQLMRRSRFPWLAANLTVGATGVPVAGLHPFIVRQFGDVRVGFLGLTAPRSASYPQTAGWTFADPFAAARKWVPLARRECDILIAVTHIGSWADRVLAATVPGIDAIVGGDSHTYLRAPVLVKGPEGRRVPVAQAGDMGLMLGRLDLTFEKTEGWHLIHTEARLNLMDSRTPEDANLKQLLDRWLHTSPPQTGWWPERDLLAGAA